VIRIIVIPLPPILKPVEKVTGALAPRQVDSGGVNQKWRPVRRGSLFGHPARAALAG